MNLAKFRIQNQYTEITCISIQNNEKSEREMKETILVTTEAKRIKHLGMNLPKETKEPHTEKL